MARAHLNLDHLLAALRDRLRELLDADTVAVQLLDQEGTALVARAAKGLEEAVAPGIRILMGQGCAGRIAAERRSIVINDVDHAEVRNPLLREREMRSLLGVPLLVQGRVIGVLHVGTLRLRRFTEDEVHLLQLVGDRVAVAIEHARLYEEERHARAVAEEAVRARDQFLSIAAHELRTPVTSIKGFAQLLAARQARGQLEAARLARDLGQVAKASERLAELVEDLLDVSRLRLGRLPLCSQWLDLAALARRVVGRFQDHLGARLLVTREAGAGPSQVTADPDRLEQVLTNLLDNAVKYSPAGGEIQVTLQPDGDGVLLRVRDLGIGLPPGAAETIFEPFGRAGNATSANLPGVGLGLHICRGIVERHGGRIWAESAGEGQGTTMSVWLPDRRDSDGGAKSRRTAGLTCIRLHPPRSHRAGMAPLSAVRPSGASRASRMA